MTQQDAITRAQARIERAITEVPKDILNRYAADVFDILAIEEMKGRLLIDGANTLYEYAFARGMRAAKAEMKKGKIKV